jgi:hypothetical protein
VSRVEHHVLWPEGQPELATSTTSWWRASLRLARMQIAQLVRPHDARRIRQAISIGEPVLPGPAEARIELCGAIPPRQGWPRPRMDASNIGADARIITHAVI